MVVLPGVALVSNPEVDNTLAITVLLLLHVPPVTASLSDEVRPAQSAVMPAMGDTGLTVMFFVAVQPPPSEYVIVAVPNTNNGVAPVTMPDVLPIAAAAVLLLAQVPPV